MSVNVEQKGTVWQLIVDGKIKLTGNQLSVMGLLCKMAVDELEAHNNDYHHHTPRDFIAAIRYVSASY